MTRRNQRIQSCDANPPLRPPPNPSGALGGADGVALPPEPPAPRPCSHHHHHCLNSQPNGDGGRDVETDSSAASHCSRGLP